MSASHAPEAPERRDFILERAAELFGRRGYHATSMRDIAGDLGIRAPSLYAHIAAKEDLLYEIVADAAAQVFHHEWRALSEPRREEIASLRDRSEDLWDDILRALRPEGSRYARILALSAANWTYVWFDPEGPLGPDRVADHFTDLLLDGIRSPGKGKVKAR